jgi:preprotein translocase subunit SecD
MLFESDFSIIAAVVGLSLWVIYPPQRTILLGLDLNGGVQLILRVKTEGVEPGKRNETSRPGSADCRTARQRAWRRGACRGAVRRQRSNPGAAPGVSDVEQAKRVIKATAQLSLTWLRAVRSRAGMRRCRLTAIRSRRTSRFCRGQRPTAASGTTTFYVVHRDAAAPAPTCGTHEPR